MPAYSDDDAVKEFANALREQFGPLGSIAEMIEPNAATQDRRMRERKSFISEGLIALWNGTDSLERLEYRCVPFRDISTTGLSFWLDEDPTTQWCVVKLEIGQDVVRFKAKVVHTTREFDQTKPPFVVGCDLVCRLE